MTLSLDAPTQTRDICHLLVHGDQVQAVYKEKLNWKYYKHNQCINNLSNKVQFEGNSHIILRIVKVVYVRIY